MSSTTLATLSDPSDRTSFLVPASRSPSPDYSLRLAQQREIFNDIKNGDRAEGINLLSTHCKGQFEISPWSTIILTPELTRGIPEDMEEWEQWQKEKKENLGAKKSVKGKEKERDREVEVVIPEPIAAPIQIPIPPVKSSKIETRISKKVIPVELKEVPKEQRPVVKQRSFFDFITKPFLTSPIKSAKSDGNLSKSAGLSRGEGGARGIEECGKNEEVLAEGGCTQMVIKPATQYHQAPIFPPPSFPLGLPTSTPYSNIQFNSSPDSFQSKGKAKATNQNEAADGEGSYHAQTSAEGPFAALRIPKAKNPSSIPILPGFDLNKAGEGISFEMNESGGGSDLMCEEIEEILVEAANEF